MILGVLEFVEVAPLHDEGGPVEVEREHGFDHCCLLMPTVIITNSDELFMDLNNCICGLIDEFAVILLRNIIYYFLHSFLLLLFIYYYI
jgi:hypothetical protein